MNYRDYNMVPLTKTGGKSKYPDDLIPTYIKWVYTQALTFLRFPGAELDDLMQEGCRGLLRAYTLFDKTRGCKFITSATWWIRAYMHRYVETQLNIIHVPPYRRGKKFGGFYKPTDSTVSITMSVSKVSDKTEVRLCDIIKDKYDDVCKYYESEDNHNLLSILDTTNKNTLKMWMKGYTMADIAKKYGVTRACISLRLIKASKQIRDHIKRQEAMGKGEK